MIFINKKQKMMYSGLTNERPSSRVREPPGGRSSNIFGDAADTNPKQPAPATTAAKKENVRPISNIFGDAPSNDTPVKKAPADNVKSILFGAETNQPNQTNAMNKKKRFGINPITGRPYEEEDAEEEKKKTNEANMSEESKIEEVEKKPLHTSSKVSQPPGGRSTRLW